MGEYISKNMLLRTINSNVVGEHRSRCVQLLEAILNAPTVDVVPRAELDLLKSTITHKEEEAYNKGYEDAKADILEKLQADIARDEILAEYGDEFFEGRIAGFKAVIIYILSEDEE